MAKSRKPVHIPPVSDKEAQELIQKINETTINFKGQFDELESALGMYVTGRLLGWKVLVLIHNKRTIRKYEEILGGINIREVFQPEGPLAYKSLGLKVSKELGRFWKAVSGEEKIEERREMVKA